LADGPQDPATLLYASRHVRGPVHGASSIRVAKGDDLVTRLGVAGTLLGVAKTLLMVAWEGIRDDLATLLDAGLFLLDDRQLRHQRPQLLVPTGVPRS
jgi:hypothetical protein